MSKKNVSRLTPKSNSAKAAARPEPLGIPLVTELQVRQPVIIAAGKSLQTPNDPINVIGGIGGIGGIKLP